MLARSYKRLLTLLAVTALAACSGQQAPVAEAPIAATPAAVEAPVAAPVEAAPAAAEAAAPVEQAAAVAAITAPSGPAPVAGVDYKVIANGQPYAPLEGKVEVAEIFGYTCPGCAQFEPEFSAWKRRQPADVRVTPVAAPFGGYWDPYARAFFAADALGVLDKTHADMFKAVHVLRSLPVQGVTPEQFASFYAQHGVQGKQFTDMMKSFGVESRLSRAKQFAMRSQAQSTPSIVVNGKYLVTVDPKRGYAHLLNTVEHLIAQERAANQ